MLGAGGGIGQPISMLLKLSPLVSELRLYDVVRTLGVGADLGHIDSDVRRPHRRHHCRRSYRSADSRVRGAAGRPPSQRTWERKRSNCTPRSRAATS